MADGCPVLGISHRVAAWNTLCSLIDQSLQSDICAVRQIIWDHGVWKRALGLYLDHAHNARPKSSRQLLVTLTGALQKRVGSGRVDSLEATTKALIFSLIDYEDAPRAKAAMQLLAHLLSKRVLNVQELPSAFTMHRPGVCVIDDTLGAQDLLEVLLRWLGKGDFGSTIASSVAIILDKLDQHRAADLAEEDRGAGSQPWRTPLESVFDQGNVNVDDLRAHIFPMLFKRKPADFASFVQRYGIEGGSDPCTMLSQCGPRAELLYAALQTGKSLGLLIETDGKMVTCLETIVAIPLSLVGMLLSRAERSARLTGLSLLLTTPTPSKPLSMTTLTLFKKALSIFFADVDADFRSEVFGAFQRLVDRLRSVTAVLYRSLNQHPDNMSPSESPQTSLQRHRDLIQWLLRFLAQELRPTANYQRHISALRCLSILARSGLDNAVAPRDWSKSAQGQIKWPFEVPVIDSDMRRLLIDLLMDPFDDVRQSAFAVLSLYCSAHSQKQMMTASSTVVAPASASNGTIELYLNALNRSEAIMYQTGRADHADGVAYLYSLYYQSCVYGPHTGSAWQDAESTVLEARLLKKLKTFVETAQNSLSEAVASFPLHGLLTSLRYVLIQRHMHVEDHTSDHLPDDLYTWLTQIWELVKPILCDDAPEGYLPEELVESINDTKETLSYCWRALKEGSLLLNTLVSLDPGLRTGQNTKLHEYSALCFTQLAELRHRGAFSTVAQTWLACCIRVRDTPCLGLPQLEIWYADVLRLLQNNVTINTRRSAGIPALLCGILVADSSGRLVAQAMSDLESIARQGVDQKSAEEGSLAQVHAINCFKDILKNSRLGEQSEPFLAHALQLSADSLRSDAWAVRNCGLMLFRAVIDRLLGTSDAHFDDDAQIQKRISTEAYPQLLDVVLDLLKAPAHGTTTRFEGVFPALQLLQLTRIPQDRLAETRSAIGAMTASSSWHVRDKAAHTLASLTPLSELALQLDELMSEGILQENRVHGLLLLVRYTLTQARCDILGPGSPEHEITIAFYDCSCLARTCGQLYHLTRSPVTKAASLDALRACSAFLGGINTMTREQFDHAALLLTLARADSVNGHAIEIFQALLDDIVHDPAAAVIRQAWSRLVAQYLMAQPIAERDSLPHLYDMIVALSQHDEDAVVHLLQSLCPAQVDSGTPMSELIMKVCTYITGRESSMGLKCVALSAVSKHAEAQHNSPDFGSGYMQSQSAGLDSNQQLADHELLVQASHINAMVGSKQTVDELLVGNITAWADACVASINGIGMHTREAAAEALNRASSLWRLLNANSNLNAHFLHLCIAVYDLLNDDDEDIRLLASSITTRIMAGGPTWESDSEPLVASQKLLAFCIKKWPSQPALIATAFKRAFNLTRDHPPPSIADQLTAASLSDTALFAEEEQNLYIDESKEIRVWSQVLQKLSSQAIDKSLITNLAQWITSHHADNLTPPPTATPAEPRSQITTNNNTSNNPSIYTLGLQVIHAIEFLLHLSQRGNVKIPVQPSELRKKLFAMVSAWEKAGANCLWRWEAERVLTASLSYKISSVSGFIGKGLEEHI